MDLAAILNGTRGQVVTLIRSGVSTVAELRRHLSLTENAVRSHLLSLERDHVIEVAGHRASGRRPAAVYRLTEAAEGHYHRGYEPVLVELARVLQEGRSHEDTETLFGRVGERLAEANALPSEATFQDRLSHVQHLFGSLGALVEAEEVGREVIIRGSACPLGSLIAACPGACNLGQTLVSAVMQRPVETHCRTSERPACEFLIKAAG
jgi:predicted ArsR family transcriptional regulator